MRTTLFPLALLAGAALLAGCGGSPERQETTQTPLAPLPVTPPPPAEAPVFDYTQVPLAEMSEAKRAEYIELRFRLPAGIADTERGPAPPGAPPGDEFDHRLRIPGSRQVFVVDPRIAEDPRLWTSVGAEYSPYAETVDGRTEVVTRRWEPLPFVNTLFFGTLGGIIGHQCDDTEEGVLIGAGYGLLLDLMRW
jgi:hypothetical protein